MMMLYYKYETEIEARLLQSRIDGELNLQLSIDNTSTTYFEPFEYDGEWYYLADDITKQYTNKVAEELIYKW